MNSLDGRMQSIYSVSPEKFHLACGAPSYLSRARRSTRFGTPWSHGLARPAPGEYPV